MVPEKWSAELNLVCSYSWCYPTRLYSQDFPSGEQWWVGAVFVCLGWKQIFTPSFSSRKRVIPEFPSECMAYSTLNIDFQYNTFPGIAKTPIFNNMFPLDRVISVLMTSEKEMTMQRKLNCQWEKHEKNFPFQLLFIFFLVLLYSHSKNLKVWFQACWNEQESFQWPQWVWIRLLLKPCCGLW